MNEIREQIYLAGLLHDIGKFYQRADTNLLKAYTLKHEEYMKSIICRENEYGGFGYQHAWWTYKFFTDNDKLFNAVTENGVLAFRINPYENKEQGNFGQNNLINLAIFHHMPGTDAQKLVQLADWWSSGIERTPDKMEKDEDDRYGKFKYKKVRLKNLMALLNNGNKITTFSLDTLNINKNVFEKGNELVNVKTQDNVEATQAYQNLWQAFNKQLEFLPTDSIKGFSDSLLFLLQKFTWCIPASTNDLAHISLYEHLKTTAAISLALYDYQQDSGCTYLDLKNNNEVLPLLLSCWDISGIQKFIYNVSGRKAAVSLKGRSFYLQLLMETVKQKVLDHPEIKGFTGQIIYSSGGKMFLLLPNTEKCKKSLQEIQALLENIIWKEHKEQLYLNHGYVAFRCITHQQGGIIFQTRDSGYENKTIAELWSAVIEAAAANKYRKYSALLKSEIEFKEHGEWSPNHDLCVVTGREGIKNRDLVKLDKKEDETTDNWVLKSVRAQVELGEGLKDINCLLAYKGENGNNYLNNRFKKEGCHLNIPGTGLHFYLYMEGNNSVSEIISSVDNAIIRKLNDTEFQRVTSLKGNINSYGFQFYGGNKQAQTYDNEKNKLRNKTFEELCWISEEKKAETFLGVLRMDIDNLGKLFKDGLKEEMRSFAAYSTLSAQLDWFFSGYLNTIRDAEEFKDTVNIIYSGGDDVFAVGRWDKIILFAEKIRSEFREYTGGREDISISAGISVIGPKYPIRLAANEAGEAEDQSKDFNPNNLESAEKNAITFFGQTISWKDEFQEVKNLMMTLKNYCSRENKPVSKALLHQLIQWKILKDEFLQSINGRASPSFQWHTAYYLKRYIELYKEDEEIKTFLKKLQAALMCGQAMYSEQKYGLRIYDLTALAARWVEMSLKEFSSNLNT